MKQQIDTASKTYKIIVTSTVTTKTKTKSTEINQKNKPETWKLGSWNVRSIQGEEI